MSERFATRCWIAGVALLAIDQWLNGSDITLLTGIAATLGLGGMLGVMFNND